MTLAEVAEYARSLFIESAESDLGHSGRPA